MAPVQAELVECDPQQECLSLDPGTRIKTHILVVKSNEGALLWERSLYSQYDTREVCVTSTRVFVGYDDRVVALAPQTGEELVSHRMYLFEYFERLPENRIMVKEKGSIIVLDENGTLLWEHGGGQILANVVVHGRDHVFVHFWGGSDVDGLQVPFACLSLATGQLDLGGPATPPSFESLAAREDIAGPGNKAGAVGLRENARQLALNHPTVWIRAMAEYVNG